jgi:hypothetical protein
MEALAEIISDFFNSIGQTRTFGWCPLHDRSSTESGSPFTIFRCPRGAKLGHSERHLQEHGEWNSASSVRRIPLTDVIEFGAPH